MAGDHHHQQQQQPQQLPPHSSLPPPPPQEKVHLTPSWFSAQSEVVILTAAGRRAIIDDMTGQDGDAQTGRIRRQDKTTEQEGATKQGETSEWGWLQVEGTTVSTGLLRSTGDSAGAVHYANAMARNGSLACRRPLEEQVVSIFVLLNFLATSSIRGLRTQSSC